MSNRLKFVAIGAVALFIGVGIGGASAGGADKTAELEGELSAVQADLADMDSEQKTSEAALEDAEAALADSQADLDEAEANAAEAEQQEDEATPIAADEPAPAPSSPTDSYEADGYTFTDVQVTKDYVGDFEVQARVTNESGESGMRSISASVFSGGSVVATADGMERINPGETMTVELISVDKFDEAWDEVEFSVERW